MATIVQLKRSSVSGKLPDAANIQVGEPVVNLADQILFTKTGTGDVIIIGAGTTSNVTEGSNLYYSNTRVLANVVTYLQNTPTVNVENDLNVNGTLNTPNFAVSDTLTIGSQIIYAQGTNGFSVNEDFDASANALQTAYHFTSGAGRTETVFSLARTGQFTDGFGITGTAASNKFVTFGEQNNTGFEWRRGVGIRPFNLNGGTLLANLTASGNLIVSGNVSAVSFIGDGSRLTNISASVSNAAILAAVSDSGILTTANVAENTNLYYTNARARSAFTAGTGITITDGEISATGGGGGSVTVSDTEPVSPSEGDLWFQGSTGIFYIFYNGFFKEYSRSLTEYFGEDYENESYDQLKLQYGVTQLADFNGTPTSGDFVAYNGSQFVPTKTFSSFFTVTPSTSAPTAPTSSFAVADGVSWDPASKSGSVPYPVFYNGSQWVALY